MLARSLRPLAAFAAFVSGVAVADGTTIPADTPVAQLAGRVQWLIVEDPARNAMHRFPVLVTAGERFVLRGAGADGLADGTPVAVQAKVVHDLASADAIVTTGPPEPRAAVATAGAGRNWTGRLLLGHADNFDGQPSHFFYSLVTRDAAPRELRLAAATGVLANGMRVSVHGDLGADGAIVPDRIVIETGSDPDPPPRTKASGNPAPVRPPGTKH